MLAAWAIDSGVDAHPVTNEADVAKRHTGLGHPEGAGIHTHEHNFFGTLSESIQVQLMSLVRVTKRVVDVRDGLSELKGVNRVLYDVTTKPPGTIEWE